MATVNEAFDGLWRTPLASRAGDSKVSALYWFMKGAAHGAQQEREAVLARITELKERAALVWDAEAKKCFEIVERHIRARAEEQP